MNNFVRTTLDESKGFEFLPRANYWDQWRRRSSASLFNVERDADNKWKMFGKSQNLALQNIPWASLQALI